MISLIKFTWNYSAKTKKEWRLWLGWLRLPKMHLINRFNSRLRGLSSLLCVIRNSAGLTNSLLINGIFQDRPFSPAFLFIRQKHYNFAGSFTLMHNLSIISGQSFFRWFSSTQGLNPFLEKITKKCVERNQLNADDPCSF